MVTPVGQKMVLAGAETKINWFVTFHSLTFSDNIFLLVFNVSLVFLGSTQVARH